MEDVFLIYFEQNFSFCAIIYSIQVFCKNSSLNSANFIERVFFALVLQNFTKAQNTLYECHSWQILRLLQYFFWLKIARLRFKAFVTCSPYSQWLLALQSGLFRSLQGPTAQRAFLLPFWKLLTLWRCQLVSSRASFIYDFDFWFWNILLVRSENAYVHNRFRLHISISITLVLSMSKNSCLTDQKDRTRGFL